MRTFENENFKSLEKLISFNAYHLEFDESKRTTDIILNLSLQQAEFGNGKHDPLSFVARLREVEVEAFLPPTSNLRIHPRTTPPKQVDQFELEDVIADKDEHGTDTTLGGKPILLQVVHKTNQVLNSDKKTKRVIDELSVVPTHVSKFRRYVTIRPNVQEFFDGNVLNERHEFALATVKDGRTQDQIDRDIRNQTQPVVHLHVRFLRRNLSIEIDKIHNDYETRVLSERMHKKGASDKRIAAAECFLRDLLLEQGLPQAEVWRDGTIIQLAQMDAEAI